MADLTPEAIAELRKMHAEAVTCRAQFEGKITARMAGVFVDRLPALLDAAEWAVKLQADIKAGMDAIDRGEFTTVDKMRDELTAEVLDAAERCAAYDAKLTAVMPPDFKDWHENDKSEWPETAAWCITNWRERCAAAEAQAKAAGELLRAAKALLDESDIIQCDNPIVIPRFMDAIAAAERAGVKP